eukprot:NODE_1934_length_2333_cov_6.985947.p1 GENE.NODE_1934_length_2333_cov_6.985947~~NODE_1934_length_2333_cov_6.985947.p1  ORF type:complete len:738 (+),score=225.01 NODE_1934_length_2333_cov_6.985947:138-2216(+)
MALGIEVSIERAGGKVSQLNGHRVLFYVGGIALMTLMINATTCPSLVRWLGITAMSDSKKKVVQLVHEHAMELGKQRCEEEEENRQRFCEAKRKAVDSMMRDVQAHLMEEDEDDDGMVVTGLRVSRASVRGAAKRAAGSIVGDHRLSAVNQRLKRLAGVTQYDLMDCADVVHDVKAAYAVYESVKMSSAMTDILQRDLPHTLADAQLRDLEDLLEDAELRAKSIRAASEEEEATRYVDPELQRAVNEAFLALVRSKYDAQVEEGHLTTDAANLLCASVVCSKSQRNADLCDYTFMHNSFESGAYIRDIENSNAEGVLAEAGAVIENAERSPLQENFHILATMPELQMVIFGVIFLNMFLVFYDEFTRTYHRVGNDLEIFFLVVFFVEFLVKFADEWCGYFRNQWNLFDFSLLILGIAGVVISATEGSDEYKGKKHTDLAKAARVLRMLRIMRAVRFCSFIHLLEVISASIRGKDSKQGIAEWVQRYQLAFFFCKAHHASQKDLLYYLSRRGKVEVPEVARCLLQSQASVYKGLALAIHAEQRLGPDGPARLKEMGLCRQQVEAAEKLAGYVGEAEERSIVSGTEASTITHTIDHHVKEYIERSEDLRLGRSEGRWAEKISRVTRMLRRSTGPLNRSLGSAIGDTADGSEGNSFARIGSDRLLDCKDVSRKTNLPTSAAMSFSTEAEAAPGHW